MRIHTQFFGDTEHNFLLRIKEIDELQRLTGAGIGDIAMRVMDRRPYYRDVYDLIRLALIGGGKPAAEAQRIVDMYVDGRPLASIGDDASPMLTAMNIINMFWFGITELAEIADTSGKDQDATQTESTSASSMGKVRASGGRRSKSKK